LYSWIVGWWEHTNWWKARLRQLVGFNNLGLVDCKSWTTI